MSRAGACGHPRRRPTLSQMRKLGRGIRNFAIVWLAWQAFIGTGYVIYSFVTGSYGSAVIALSLVLISVGLSGTLWKWSGYGKQVPSDQPS